MKLVLWDIDGTLLRGGTSAADAYETALRTTFQLEGEFARISYGGKTDAQIALELLRHHDITEADAFGMLEMFRETYTRELERRRQHLQSELTVLPGVRAVLAHLQSRGVRQSILTGNYAATAEIKLACAGLTQYFDLAVGAFGSDHHDRNCLVPIALERACRRYQAALAAEDLVIVGDTPRDIACARAAGARVVAVATGSYSAAELARHEPDVQLDSLCSTSAAVAAILAENA